jgi:hypothetical protein
MGPTVYFYKVFGGKTFPFLDVYFETLALFECFYIYFHVFRYYLKELFDILQFSCYNITIIKYIGGVNYEERNES